MSALLEADEIEPAADLLKSLANPQRLMIVCALIEAECSVAELERTLEIRQPSLSQHLASLREAGIIAGRREAKFVFYRLNDRRAARIIEALHEIFGRQTAELTQSSMDTPPSRIPQPAAVPPEAPRAAPGEAAWFARLG